MPEEAKLYIGNIPFSVTESQIRRMFDPYGPIEEVKIVYDRVTDKPKGYAFVTFETIEDSRDAMKSLHNEYLGERQIKVEQSKQDGRYDSGRSRYGRGDDRYGRGDDRYGRNDYGRRYDRRGDRSSRDDRFGRRDRESNYDRRDSYRDGRSGGGRASGGRRNDSRGYEQRSRSDDRF